MQKNTPVPHLNKGISCQEKGDKTAVLSRLNKGVAKFRSVAPRTSDVCAENFSHSARLWLQQSRASYMLALCLRAVLISSPDWYVSLNENARVGCNAYTDIMWKCGQCPNKGAFLYYRYLYFTRGIDASYRHTSYRYIDPYRWIVTPLIHIHIYIHTHTYMQLVIIYIKYKIIFTEIL